MLGSTQAAMSLQSPPAATAAATATAAGREHTPSDSIFDTDSSRVTRTVRVTLRR